MIAGDEASLRVQLLGPVRAWRGEGELDLGPPRQRAVFGILAMRANQTVSRAELVDSVWGQDPPASAVNSLHIYVAGLRRALEPGRASRAPGQVLLASRTGYLLRLEPGQPDARAFCEHLARAREAQAAADLVAVGKSVDAALRLWQAAPLSGIPGPWAELERARLGGLWLTAVEESIEVLLARGRHAEAAAELPGLIAEYPLRERFRGQLMLALYRCSRQAEALAVFAETRHVLVEELGIEPGPELRRLQKQILLADGALDLPASADVASKVPTQLPADVRAFTGREAELREMDRFLAEATGQPGQAGQTSMPSTAVVISAVSGTAGVGKTALALRWAHRVRGMFPDGQLYVNLRGYDPGQPVPAADALAGFLRALGMAGPDVPAETDERAAAYRTLLDGRRMLVVLDNAATVEQVRPILPGGPSCVVLVTSRDSLAGLVAGHGARRLDLDLLPPGEAVGLLRALIGQRVAAEPGAAATLARQCARLPLALRVAAELAAGRPAMTLAELADELADERRRLDLLDAGGDLRTAVRSVFSWSYQCLDGDAARAFRLIGLHPGPDFDAYAVAALTATPLGQSRRILGLLARAHLIQPAHQGRSGLHDLLRAYALDLTAAEDHESERQAALTCLFDYYLTAAATAMDALFPAEQHRRPRTPAPATPIPPVADPAAARAWLDAERNALIAVAAHTAAHGWPGHTTLLAATLGRYLANSYCLDAIAIHTHARQAARNTGDKAAEATALTSIGAVHRQQGRYEQSARHHRQALALFEEIGDRTGEARTLSNLGAADWRQGCYEQAADHFRQALAVFHEIGDRTGEARTLSNLGGLCRQQGRYEQACDHHRRSAAMCREIGDRYGEARALSNLGATQWRQGCYEQAADHIQQALTVFRDVSDHQGEAHALTNLGAAVCRQGHYAQAADYEHQALALFREIGDRIGEAEALNFLGEILLATGRADSARATHNAALSLASQIGDSYEQARAHDCLAHTYQAVGDLGQADEHRRRALAHYGDLGLPVAEDVGVLLARGRGTPHRRSAQTAGAVGDR